MINHAQSNMEEKIMETTETYTSNISHKDEIETVIYSLEQNDSAMVHKADGGYIWKFQYGSVEVFVQLTGENEDDLFTVWSAILSLPTKNEPQLMRQLLEMNWSGTFETCFAILNNQVVVSTQRTLYDLSPSEISRCITLVATIADQYDEQLQEEYQL
jgi:hypothetical protein